LLPAAKLATSTLAFAAVLWAAPMPLYAAGPTGVSTKDEVIANQFTDAIDSSNAQDPQSPDTLNTRLGFADFLAKSEGGDCHMRLENAQNQLDTARAGQAGIALPVALAREAAVDYQIHVGRASCDASAISRDQALRAAVESARHAVDLYRDEFDAVSMVTMQFNVAVTDRELGEDTAAVAALQTAIKMDREYGFRKDANDNYQMLLQWTGQPAGPNEVAALMKDFPQRSTPLSFGWFDSKADLTLTLDYQQLSEGGTLNMHGMTAAERRVRRRDDGWTVSFEPHGTSYEINKWPNDESLVQGVVVSLTRMPLQFHDFNLARGGNFSQSTAAHKFYSNVRSGAKEVTEFLAQNNASAHLMRQIRDESENYSTSIEDLVEEAYSLETGTWIGASLDQGVWYDMRGPLSLPLQPGLFVTHQIEFAFTRQVPCTADSSDEACVELVLRATPDPEELKKMLTYVSEAIGLNRKVALQLSSATYIRLVTEPRTLQCYETDIRRLSYWRIKGTKYHYPMITTERTHAISGPIARTE
jgi:hypothetical protein